MLPGSQKFGWNRKERLWSWFRDKQIEPQQMAALWASYEHARGPAASLRRLWPARGNAGAWRNWGASNCWSFDGFDCHVMGVTLQHDCCQEIRWMKKDGSAYSAFYRGFINLECLELQDLGCLLRQFYCTRWSRFLPEKITVSKLAKKFPDFLEPEGSLPHSQVPATCPYPKPARSPPCPIPLLEYPFQKYLPIYA